MLTQIEERVGKRENNDFESRVLWFYFYQLDTWQESKKMRKSNDKPYKFLFCKFNHLNGQLRGKYVLIDYHHLCVCCMSSVQNRAQPNTR